MFQLIVRCIHCIMMLTALLLSKSLSTNPTL